MKFPENLVLREVGGERFDLSEFASEHDCVIFIYPKMGQSGKTLSQELAKKAGMTGCTLQAKGYEAAHEELASLGYNIIAVGTHASLDELGAFKESVEAGYRFLNDSDFVFEEGLNLPTFTTGDGRKFYFRHTIIVRSGKIIASYEVDEPSSDAVNALELIENYHEAHF